jgi:alpha-amylase
LRDFLATLEALRDAGDLRLVTFSEALREVPPRGIAYLPSASYHEMEGWALPAPAARRLAALEAELGPDRIRGPEGALLRGSHWRNFFAKYAEANRMHKKMLALSRLCRERGDPPRARRAIGRAQCNDAYWHGVFGGLYLPHLRHAIWRELLRAEAELRRAEPLGWEVTDYDCDGAGELLVYSGRLSLVISPSRGAALEELSDLSTGLNHADSLTRRREPYHEPPLHPAATPSESEAVSIHNLDRSLDTLPPEDREVRAIFQERIWPAGITAEALAAGATDPVHSWARASATLRMRAEDGALVATWDLDRLTKTIRISSEGRIELTLAWEDRDWPAEAWFTTELSLGHPLAIEAPRATEWRYPIATVAQSERGLDRTIQGESVTLGWPIAARAARVTLAFPA